MPGVLLRVLPNVAPEVGAAATLLARIKAYRGLGVGHVCAVLHLVVADTAGCPAGQTGLQTARGGGLWAVLRAFQAGGNVGWGCAPL